MTTISGKWVGSIQGSNAGAVFAEFVETKGQISGVVHINDTVQGGGVYTVTDGHVNPDDIRLVLTPNQQTKMAGHGIVTVLARMLSQTKFVGDPLSVLLVRCL